jgi:hypothetical protein
LRAEVYGSLKLHILGAFASAIGKMVLSTRGLINGMRNVTRIVSGDGRLLTSPAPSCGILDCRLDAQHEVTYVDPISFSDDGCLLNPTSVDVRPVRAVQISYDELTLAKQQLCVLLGYVAFGQQQIVTLDSADTQF